MGATRRKTRSRKTYSEAAFATRRKLRRMRLRDQGGNTKTPKFWFTQGGCADSGCALKGMMEMKVEPPRL